jgi:acylphosphatase
LEKKAFWTFLEHKSEENGKVLIFFAGTVHDGVKRFFMTASRVKQEVEVAKVHDGPVQDYTKEMTRHHRPSWSIY